MVNISTYIGHQEVETCLDLPPWIAASRSEQEPECQRSTHSFPGQTVSEVYCSPLMTVVENVSIAPEVSDFDPSDLGSVWLTERNQIKQT